MKAIEELKSNLEQYQRSLQPRCESQHQKGKESPMEVPSSVATRLEAAAVGKKTRSWISLASAEVFAKWDKGLCECCDEPYFPWHKCKKIGPNTLFVVVAEEEDTMQSDFGVENPPAVDAPQVFDESLKSNPDISSDGWVGGGQGKPPVGSQNAFCEQLDGLNLSNSSLEKSTSSIHDKVTSNAQGKQQVYDMEHPFVTPLGFPEPHEGWKEIDCDGHIKQLSGVPVLFMPGNGGSYKQGGLELDFAKLSFPNQYTSMLDWFAADLKGEHSAMDGQILKEQQRNHGWKEANGFCVLVFDLGILGSGQSALPPDIVVFNPVLDACVPSHQWKVVSWVFEQLKKGGSKTNGATYGLAMEVTVPRDAL